MATKLSRPVRRTTEVIVERRRRLVVSLYPHGTIGVRASGLRTEYELPLDAVYALAVKAEVARRKVEKAAARGRQVRRR
jgi:hypothetical protein